MVISTTAHAVMRVTALSASSAGPLTTMPSGHQNGASAVVRTGVIISTAALAMMTWISPSAALIASSATGHGCQMTWTAGSRPICSADVYHHRLRTSSLVATFARSQIVVFVAKTAINAAGPGPTTTQLDTSLRMPCAGAQMAETETESG